MVTQSADEPVCRHPAHFYYACDASFRKIAGMHVSADRARPFGSPRLTAARNSLIGTWTARSRLNAESPAGRPKASRRDPDLDHEGSPLVRCSELLRDALHMALRQPPADVPHHSDRDTQLVRAAALRSRRSNRTRRGDMQCSTHGSRKSTPSSFTQAQTSQL